MKKYSVIILCLLMAFIMVGCGNNNAKDVSSPAGENTSKVESLESEGMANPMQEITDENLIKIYSRGFVLPEGVKKADYYLYDGSLFEIRFEKNGVSFNARAEEGNASKDISGMNYEWTTKEDGALNNPEIKISTKRFIGADETVDVVCWYDEENDINYSLSATAADLDGFDITAIVSQMYKK